MRILLVCFTMLLSYAAQAAEFEIFQSKYQPLKLAWMVDAPSEDKEASNLIRNVVRHDLESSQSFETLNPLSFLADIKQTELHIDYGDWRIIGADILAIARLHRTADGWKAYIEVHDPFRNKVLSRITLDHSGNILRPLAHQIANHIYHAATGIAGYFNSHILYVRKHGDTADLIYMDQDGANRQAVGRNFTLLLSPDWSPDNHLVALNTYVGNRPRLETFDLSNGKRRTFGAFPGLNSTPEWSPDGRYIAATLSRTGNAEIHIFDTRTRTWRQLTHNPAIDTTPTWSPDGKWIAFTSDRSGSPQIYRIRISNRQVQRISTNGPYNTSPAWSPAGERIALITRKGWEYALATMRLDGSGIRYLATGGRIESPAWSPNAQMLLFSKEVKGVRKVYRVPGWGGKAQAITSPVEDASDPAWSR
ncbi:MAG: Tol-Pal system beta propeller repeat protein TolB [Mariprofundaceae bacterium]|nr:Tol-Pal system beta propeller repeat protein TolB [Mariprofundaceae bacterium]